MSATSNIVGPVKRASRVTAALRLTAPLFIAAFVSACDNPTTQAKAEWPGDCAPMVRPAPLSLDAAREAFRTAERRHEVRLREAAAPGSFLRSLERAQAGDAGSNATAADLRCLSGMAQTGEMLFEHEFSYANGLGSGDAARSSKGPFRRVHAGVFGGPETISCSSCHWVGGPNGAGAETDNAFLTGDGESPASGDARNPQALIALGVVQALAREMTVDLQAQRAALTRDASEAGEAREARLVTKGVDFGVLRVDARGSVDGSGIEGVDEDLVVKPFGWKGTRPDIGSFITEALQVHMGIQTDDLVRGGPSELAGSGKDAEDPDGDGVRGEFSSNAMSALTVHLALLETPIVEPLNQDRVLEPAATALLPPTTTSFVEDFAQGRKQFHALGCASCHRPMLLLEDATLEIPGLPPIDLAREMRRPALRYDETLGGYPVWLFSDLKRHDMGRANVARHRQLGVARRLYLTPRLWGVADSAPYLHDGRAPSFDYAIAGHDGEGAAARAAYAKLSWEEKGPLRVYLMSLRRASRVIVP